MDREQRVMAEEVVDRGVPGPLLAGVESTIREAEPWCAGSCGATAPTATVDETTLRSVDPLVADLVVKANVDMLFTLWFITNLRGLVVPFTSDHLEEDILPESPASHLIIGIAAHLDYLL